MKSTSDATYSRLTDGAEVIELDPHGPKVLILRDGSYLKLFRRKRLLSRALFFPPEKRFRNNCDELRKRGIDCPTVIATYAFPEIGRTAIRYHPLAGETLRSLLPKLDESPRIKLLEEFAGFIAELHDKGIYFRSLHLGNVIFTPEGKLGLIDLSDIRSNGSALSKGKRKRNFRHLLRYKKDVALIRVLGLKRFFMLYNRNTPVRIDSQSIIPEQDRTSTRERASPKP